MESVNRISIALISLGLFFAPALAGAVCPAPGAGTTAAGTVGDKCGNSTTGVENKACCLTGGATGGIFWIENSGTPFPTRIESACAEDVMIPGKTSAEWTAFATNKPACVTIIASYTWIGLVDNNWSTAANWSTGVVPGASNVAIFDENCQANCAAIDLDVAINVAGVLIDPDFPASTFTAGAVSIAIGASAWIQQSTAGLTMNGASATSVSGPLQITTGTFNVSTGTNSFSTVTVDGGILNTGANTVAISGAVAVSAGDFVTTSGTNTFAGAVTISGTGEMDLGAAGTNTVTGLLTVSSTTANAYNSGGTDVFNGGVTLSGSGGMTTGTSLTENGAVTISAGTWTLTSGTNNINNNGLNGVTMTGGTLLPDGTVAFKATATSLTMNGGTFGTTTTAGTITFAGAVTMRPSSAAVFFHNGTATITATGLWTIREAGGNANLVTYGDGSAGTNTFNGGLTIIRELTGGTAINPRFIQGSTNLSMSTFNFSSDTTAITGAFGAFFGNAALTNGGSGNMLVTGNFTFNCQTRADANKFYATSGDLEIRGNVSVSNNACNGSAIYDVDNVTTNFRITGGTQTVATTATVTYRNFVTGFTANTQTKTIPISIINGTLNVNDSGFTGGTTTFGSALTMNGTGTVITYNSTGAMTVVNTGAITATTGSMQLNSTTGVFTWTNTGGTTIGATSNGNVTLNPTGTGTLVMNSNTLNVGGSLISNDSGGKVSGNINIAMTSSQTPVAITLGAIGVLGTTGTFVVNKGAAGNIVGLGSTPVSINRPGQTLTITQGTVQLNPATGACSGATSCTLNLVNLTITTNGSLICGVGTFAATGTITITGGTINCSGYGFNWTGTTGDGKWSTTGNWSNNLVPGVADTAVFNATYCGANCNATIDTAQTPFGVHMATGYGGTITHSANITVGLGGFKHEAGTFLMGAANFTLTGAFLKTGGTFTPGAGTMAFNATTAQALTLTSPPGTFTGPVSFGGTNATYTLSGTLTVSGLLTLQDAGTTGAINGGVISATGDVTTNANGYRGNTTLTLAGAGSPTITASGTLNALPNISITNTTGPITFAAGGTFVFTAGFAHSGAASLTTTGATFQFSPAAAAAYTWKTAQVLNNVTFSPTVAVTMTSTNVCTVAGTLTFQPAAASVMNGGGITHTGATTGAVNFNGTFGMTGTTPLTLSGTANRTLTSVSGPAILGISVTATAGTITLASGSILNFVGAFSWTGTALMDATGSTVRFSPTANVAYTWDSSETFNNVSFLSTGITMTSTNTINVAGALIFQPTANAVMTGGTINHTGATTGTINFNGTFGITGTGLLQISGTANRTLTSASGPAIMNTSVTATAGTITLANTSILNFVGSFSWTGTAAMTATGSTVRFTPTANQAYTFDSTQTFAAVSFLSTGVTTTITNTINVAGALIVQPTAVCTLTGGTINHTGATTGTIVFGSTFGCQGSTLLQVSGTANRTITNASGALMPAFAVTATAGTVTFASASILNMSNNYSWTGAAALTATGSTLRFNANFNYGITAGSTNVYNNVDISPSAGAPTITLEDTMTVAGTLNFGATAGLCTFTKGVGAGVISFTGTTANITGTGVTRGCAGTGTLQISGASVGNPQTLNNAGAAAIPTFVVTANTPKTLTFGSATVFTFRNDYTYSGSAVLTPGTAVTRFASTAAAAITPGASTYYQANFDAAGPFTLTGTLVVSNLMTFGGTIGGTVNGGTIEMAGANEVFSHAYTGTTAETFSGTGASNTVTTSAGAGFNGLTGLLTVNKSGQSLTYSNAVTFANTKAIQLTAGTLSFSGNVNANTTTSTWTGTAGTQFNLGAATTNYIGNLILNTAVFDKNSATTTITNASAPCTNGPLTVGNPICGGNVTN